MKGMIPMDNIKQMLKNAKNLKYTKKDKIRLIKKSLSQIGAEEYIVIAMEEMAELNDVILENTMGKFDYIHTTEEIVDVLFCVDMLKIVFNIKEKDLKKIKKSDVKASKKVLLKSVQTLAKSQQVLSKTIRHRDRDNKKLQEKVIPVINNLNQMTAELCHMYDIRNKDIKSIEDLKIWRLEKRTKIFDSRKRK